MTPLVLKRSDLRSLALAIIEHEKRGYECVAPYKKMKTLRKNWNYNRSNNDFKDFRGVDEYEYYIVKMRKVESA